MRREARKQLPALSHWFHLTPMDLDELWPGELDVYLSALVDMQKDGRGRG